ncbi:hypothetical protein B296_00031951 [Ensete ventricosum]|uniref:Myb-like domain-containing protein n=1 Tax=Ensete ventricosum TaxID=4639 RepID=A0A427A0W8_ENSVE|nr:hypothetical protein B296_00031951 [Ensete ventricosum]
MDYRGWSNLVGVNGVRGVYHGGGGAAGGLNNARSVVAVGEGSAPKHNPGSPTDWTEEERAIFEEGVLE